MSQRPALLLIDMQMGLFHGPDRPHDADGLLARSQILIAAARAAGAPVFAARHTGPDGSPIAVGSPAWQLMPELGLDPACDIIFNKTRPSCFQGTEFAARLAALGCDSLVIAGLKTQYCVDTTCRVAAELGLQVQLAADAHSCMDTPMLKAEAIIAHHNATLAGPFARVLPVADIGF